MTTSSSDFAAFASEAASDGSTFLGAVLKEVQSGYITSTASLEATAAAIVKDYQKYSDTAVKFADKAFNAGDVKGRELFNKIALVFSDAANQKTLLGTQNFLEKVSQDAKAASAGLASKLGPAADALKLGIGAIDAVSTGNTSELGSASAGILGGAAGVALGASVVGLLVAAGFIATSAIWLPALIIGGFALGLSKGAEMIWDWFDPNDVAAPFNDGKDVLPPRRDPLTLDLDGDGLETTGIAATNPIQFDHDGDGIKNGTGWVLSDDAFLVLDKNGNGSIDNGRELFGDSTIKSNGQTAADGFDALADLDSNADGKISNLDAQFANLRLWRDLNQDGISQTGELFTLSTLNIASINVAKTANSQTLTNGNQIADLGTFTKTDGSTGTTGAVTGNMADINLASDTFHHPSLRAQSAWQSKQSHDKAGLLHKVRNDSSVSENDTKWRIAA